jgi:hypothetical protein
MKIQQLLDHHGITTNPFAEEDAQTDLVFKDYCIDSTYHPAWDKVYGDPAEPATSVVFGEKGSGKTAMRLQIARHLAEYNRSAAGQRLYVIQYDDFNPFLDRFRDKLSGRRRRVDRVLREWKLWDHMDAILTLGVTGLVDQLLEPDLHTGAASAAGAADQKNATRFDRHQARDLLLLAACYDQSTAETFIGRWNRLRRRLRFWRLRAQWDLALGVAVSLAVAATVVALACYRQWGWLKPLWLYLYLLLIVAGFVPWLTRAWRCFRHARHISRRMRVGHGDTGSLSRILRNFRPSELSGQPLPNKERTDDRYELLAKFQGLLKTLGYSGIIVLVDRVDEPHLINGSAELMQALLWPMLDNKFLKQPGIGLKMMLPIELSDFVRREDRDFYQRARLDKQNMIPSLEWTGESLYDVANARIRACAADGASPTLDDLFDPSVSQQRLVDALRSLRVPRHLFKFMYRLFVAHCNAHTDQQPAWKVSRDTFESVLAVYNRDQEALDRGLGPG